MSEYKPYYSKARVTLELASPLLIATGDAQGGFDNAIIRDANQLPMIPGTSIAGVLKHLAMAHGSPAAKYMGGEEQRSELRLSSAAVHDSNNRACDGLKPEASKDELLDFLQQPEPMARDRVALNQKGVAIDGAKFDMVMVPTGSRFSFELNLQTSEAHEQAWQVLINLIHSNSFRLGQKTRSGLGRVKVSSCHAISLDLSQHDDYQQFRQLPRRLGETQGLQVFTATAPSSQLKAYRLAVKAEAGLRIGQGSASASKGSHRIAHALPWSEPIVTWSDNNKATIDYHRLVIPGSSIKGALLHRTLFHYRCLTGDFIDEGQTHWVDDSDVGHLTLPEPLQTLFGVVPQEQDGQARAGQVYVDDIYLDGDIQTDYRQHNSIDRFTGGTRDGVLFSEELLWQPKFDIDIYLNTEKQIEAHCIEAFERSLDDLVEARLAIGAGSSKGHGYLIGERK